MNDSFYLDVYWTLRKTVNVLRTYLHNKLADSGISWPQFHALYHIPENGIPVNELAKELHCNASNITGLIDRMIENNWVYREHSAEDRRVWLIKLTNEGSALKAKLIPVHHNNIRERLSVLSDEELANLKTLLIKLMNEETID